MTSVEHRDPTAASAGDGREAERRGDVPTPRKCAASLDAVGELEAKRTRSPRPSEVSPALSPPALGAAGQARRSEERSRTPASSGPAPARDPQWGDAPPAALVGTPRAGGRGDARAERELARSTLPSVEVRGRSSRPVGDPRPAAHLWQNLLRNWAHVHLSMSQQTSDSVHKFPTT